MSSEAQIRASVKYNKVNVKQVSIKLHNENDADIIERLNGVDNRLAYIKRLIREEMNNERKSKGR